ARRRCDNIKIWVRSISVRLGSKQKLRLCECATKSFVIIATPDGPCYFLSCTAAMNALPEDLAKRDCMFKLFAQVGRTGCGLPKVRAAWFTTSIPDECSIT